MFSSRSSVGGQHLVVLVGILTLLAGVILTVGRCVADIDDDDGTGTLIRVEEDWLLVVTTPDANVASPQVSTQMRRSPYSSRFCAFHLNSCDIPTFTQGGLQLQAWQGDSSIAVQTSENRSTMTTPNEMVQWTQYLRREGNVLKFGIKNAISDPSPGTWGDFSTSAAQEITVSTTSAYLGNYTADYSLTNSGITFGANRVEKLQLLEVRKYTSDNPEGPPQATINWWTLPTYGIVYQAPVVGGDQ